MPITKDRFDRISDEEAQLDDDANRILDFLIRNDDKAYTKREIAEETGVDDESIEPALERLKERGSVEHKTDYWRVTDHELAVRCGTALTAETACQHEDGESFDVEKWAEYAVDEVDLNRGESEWETNAGTWFSDPFILGDNPRPWLILSVDSMPLPGSSSVRD